MPCLGEELKKEEEKMKEKGRRVKVGRVEGEEREGGRRRREERERLQSGRQTSAGMSVRGCRVWRRTDQRLPPSVLVEKNGVDGSLLLQNGAITTLDSDATEVEKRLYTKILDSYGLLGVLRISKEEHFLIVVTGVLSVGQIYSSDILKVTNCECVSLMNNASAEDSDPRISDIQRLLSSGMFYFSSNPAYDLTRSAQHRHNQKGSDIRFFWNRTLHYPLEKYGIETTQWALKCIAGSVLIRVVYAGAKTGKVALLSRLSYERVGTRFNVRGANYLGKVANFVETEQLMVFDEGECSLLQVRGSIPLFWEQPGVQVGSHKVKLRAFETSAPAYHRHLSQLREQYENAAIVNLLGLKEGERIVADAFRTAHKNSQFANSVEFIDFDYHSQMRSSKDNIRTLIGKLTPLLEKYSFFVSIDNQIKQQQKGVLRVNCLDCLDRTNSVETVVGLMMIKQQVAALSLNSTGKSIDQRIEEIFKDLWIKDASRSIARTIQNNLLDSSKQESFDLLLSGICADTRLYDRAVNLLPPPLIQEYPEAVDRLVERTREITQPNPIKIFAGTWNVNGGKNIHNIAFRGEANLSDWIFPNTRLVSVDTMDETPDIVAIGVEELVDLNASNMVKASTTNQRLWCDSIRRTLAEKADYILLGSEQLVGVCLFLFMRPHLAPFMKDFAVCSVKTGMGGATGNKGSVAFRIVVHSTSICFVCSHFAAGQNEIRDRNDDFQTAVRKIRFPQGKDIPAHDVIIWMGDFNYRINLSGDEVKEAVRTGQLDRIVPHDQLGQQKAQNLTFPGFEEGPLTFAPTYKYDTFSDDYDTSEKCRTPAWTDRILWREQRRPNEQTRLIRYYRSELKTSDHRPVGALFSINLNKIDTSKCLNLLEDVISCMGPPDATLIVSIEGRKAFPHTLFGEILKQLNELHIRLLLSKYEEGELWLIVNSGECALAVLSIDGLTIGNEKLHVRLKSPDWAYALKPPLSVEDLEDEADQIVNCTSKSDQTAAFEFDDDEDEVSMRMSNLPLSSSPIPSVPSVPSLPVLPPERSSSRGSTPVSLAPLDWPENGNGNTQAPPTMPRNSSFPTRPAPLPPAVPSAFSQMSSTQPPCPAPAPPQVPIRGPPPPVPPQRPQMPVIPPRPSAYQPPQLIVMTCEYLPFESTERLAWVNRRLMQIVRRNVPLALRGRLQIRTMEIDLETQNKYRTFFYCAVPVNILLTTIIRISTADVNSHVYWEKFAVEKANLAASEQEVPPVNLRLLLSRADIDELKLENFPGMSREQFWKAIDLLSTSRAAVRQKTISNFELNFDVDDIERCETSPFMHKDVKSFEITIGEQSLMTKLFQIPHFRDTEWIVFGVDATRCATIPLTGVRKLYVRESHIHFQTFLKNFLRILPLVEKWIFEDVPVENEKWNWSGIERMLKSTQGLKWSFKTVSYKYRRYEIRSLNHVWHLDISRVYRDSFYLEINGIQ
ncbi:hypothetical protein WR25_05921 [Diploscapter pachys]|uniref:phosphoinositide 5-phosphatase n=1 Tax=Diploscapter pachys TaxID=2018661 RepID=A0A2A2KVC5_9BILA|nr:hypothetical protein WR25_05921 [Diploscapter pachys]